MGEIHKECEVENNRGSENRVATQEVNFDLHLVTEPTKDVDGIPSFFVVSTWRVIVDADNMIDVAVQVWVHLWLKDPSEHTEFGHLFGLKVLWSVEYLTVTVAENVGRIPTAQTEHSCFQTRCENCLHQGLTRLEILARDWNLALLRKFHDAVEVGGEVWSAIREGNITLQCGIGINLARRNIRIVIFQPLLECCDRDVYLT